MRAPFSCPPLSSGLPENRINLTERSGSIVVRQSNSVVDERKTLPDGIEYICVPYYWRGAWPLLNIRTFSTPLVDRIGRLMCIDGIVLSPVCIEYCAFGGSLYYVANGQADAQFIGWLDWTFCVMRREFTDRASALKRSSSRLFALRQLQVFGLLNTAFAAPSRIP